MIYNKMDSSLINYYGLRSGHYEDVYQKPERQADLHDLSTHLQSWLVEKDVLEVACGTGYWTAQFFQLAGSVVATDASEPMLTLARAKPAMQGQVEFVQADAFDLPKGKFNACVAGFWWSHLKRSDQPRFLESVQKACLPGTLLVMFDNCYVEGDSTPVARTDLEGNTFQLRSLPDGSRHEILKNFPSDSALRKRLAGYGRDIRIERNHYFWMLTCILR